MTDKVSVLKLLGDNVSGNLHWISNIKSGFCSSKHMNSFNAAVCVAVALEPDFKQYISTKDWAVYVEMIVCSIKNNFLSTEDKKLFLILSERMLPSGTL